LNDESLFYGFILNITFIHYFLNVVLPYL